MTGFGYGFCARMLSRAAPPPLYAYAHGFLSGPSSYKGRSMQQQLAARFGVHLTLLDLNGGGGPAALTPTTALRALDEAWESAAEGDPGTRLRLIGSSAGGWACARYAELHPTRVERMLLLCPALDLGDRWEDLLGAPAFSAWQRTGGINMTVPNSGATVSVPYSLVEQTRQISRANLPRVQVPTTVLHGIQDAVVPIDTSERFAVLNEPLVHVVRVDDDHALTTEETMDRIFKEAAEVFQLKRSEDGGGSGGSGGSQSATHGSSWRF